MMLRAPEYVRSEQSPEMEIIRAMKRYDPALEVFWGLTIPDNVRGRRRRAWSFKSRWVVYRRGKSVVEVLRKDGFDKVMTMQPTWHLVHVVENEDGSFRALDERILHWLYRCDHYRRYGTSDGAKIADRSGKEASGQIAANKVAKEAKDTEMLEDYTKENFREIASAIDVDARKRGISL